MSAPWMKYAKRDLGLKEIVGPRHEKKVVKMFADVGHAWVKDDETAWCAAFAGSCLERAGVKSTKALNARSYLKWGTVLTKPVPGCIVIFKRGSSAWQGHVAFYVSETKTAVRVLGGNQSNSVSIANYSKAKLLGYRWPAAYKKPMKSISDPLPEKVSIWSLLKKWFPRFFGSTGGPSDTGGSQSTSSSPQQHSLSYQRSRLRQVSRSRRNTSR